MKILLIDNYCALLNAVHTYGDGDGGREGELERSQRKLVETKDENHLPKPSPSSSSFSYIISAEFREN